MKSERKTLKRPPKVKISQEIVVMAETRFNKAKVFETRDIPEKREYFMRRGASFEESRLVPSKIIKICYTAGYTMSPGRKRPPEIF